MVTFSQKQLFKLLTTSPKWFEGSGDVPPYCDANSARVLKHRHKNGELSQDSYDNLFFHFGYKKELVWTK